MSRLRRAKTKRFRMPEVVLLPLIDAALTLLVIFIVTAPAMQNGIKIDLPQGRSREVASQQDLVVTLNKQGLMYFNGYPVKKKELLETVQRALAGKDDTPVYVRADKLVSYGDVIEIVDSLKEAGVKYVAMSTVPLSKS
ncbi:MAG: biopolymer transporter ExbD [bacterium]